MAGEISLRCRQAREWASLRADGELSELEARLLDRHVAGCSDCLAWEERIGATASLLRAAPAEFSTRRFELPPRRERRVPMRQRLVLAAVVAAAALGSVLGASLNGPDSRPSGTSPQLSFLFQDVAQLRELPRREQVTPRPPVTEPAIRPEDAV